jgi:hypothetical protein
LIWQKQNWARVWTVMQASKLIDPDLGSHNSDATLISKSELNLLVIDINLLKDRAELLHFKLQMQILG